MNFRWNKVLSVLLAVVMVVGLVPANAFFIQTNAVETSSEEPTQKTETTIEHINPGTNVACILNADGSCGTHYATLKEAMTEANKTTGDHTICLLKDSAETFTFAQKSGVNITIDGEGKSFTGTITLNAGAGELKFTDMIVMPPVGTSTCAVKLNASTAPNVTFYDCVLTYSATPDYTSIVLGSASATSNKVVFEECSASKLTYLYATNQAGANEVVVENCEATNMVYLIRPMKTPKVTVKDVTYSGKTFIQVKNSNAGTLHIENVTVTTTLTSMAPITMLAPDSGEGAVYTIYLKGNNTANGEKMTVKNETVWFERQNASLPYEIIDLDFKPVASVNGVEYATLAEAIENASAGATIKFLADINENVTISKNLTIDGQNYKYTGTMTLGAVTATIQNVKFVNGEIVKTEKPISGNFTIQDCSFEGETSSGYAIKIGYASALTITGCTSKYNSFLYVPYSLASLYVNGVEIDNASWAFHLVSIEAPKFENVKITNSDCGIVVQNTGNKVVTLKNCEMDADKPLVVWEKQTNNVTFRFEGENKFGTHEAVWAIINNNYVQNAGCEYAELKLAQGATLTAAEGLTITTNIDGYEVAYNNGVYSVVEKKVYVAQIGEQGYESLQAAINAATAGDTIKFLADITEDVTVSKNVTIDGAGKTYTGTITISGDYNVTIQNVNCVKGYIVQNGTSSTAVLTVQNCSFANGGYAVTTERIDKVVIEDCTVTGQSLLYTKLTTNHVVVKNVTISKGNYVAHLVYGTDAYFENVIATEMTGYGICTQNYGAKTITLKNCSFDAPNYYALAVRDDRTTNADTFIFEGVNIMSGMYVSQYAKYVLSNKDATLTAPEGQTVTIDLTGYSVKYVNGKYVVTANMVAIDNETYASLEEALAAAKTGDTITFLADITEDVTVSKNVTIDGAGKTYTGTITISGDYNVTIQNVNCVKGYIVQNGTSSTAVLTVQNCSFANGGYAVTTERIDKVVIEDCTVTGQSLLYTKLTTNHVVVKNVTISKGNYVAHLVYGTDAYFENVIATEMTGYGICTQNYGAKTITLKNCSFDAPNYYALAVRDDRTTNADTFIFEGVNIMSGMYVSQYAKYKLKAGATLTAPEGLTITTDVQGYEVAYNNGVYSVVEEKVYVAMIGEQGYTSLADALAAAKDGDTVILLCDVEVVGKDGLIIPARVELDLNGCSLKVQKIQCVGYIIDKRKGAGCIQIAPNQLEMYVDNPYLPLYDNSDEDNGCYRFFEYKLALLKYQVGENSVTYRFRLKLSTKEAYELLLKDNCGVKIAVNLYVGTTKLPVLDFEPKLLKDYAARTLRHMEEDHKGPDEILTYFYVTLGGLDRLNVGDVLIALPQISYANTIKQTVVTETNKDATQYQITEKHVVTAKPEDEDTTEPKEQETV